MSEKKKNIIVIVLAIIAISVLAVGIIKNKGTKELSMGDFCDLIDKEYKVVALDIDKSEMSIVVSGMLSSEEIKELSKNIYILAKDNRIKEKSINLKVVEDNVEALDEFYFVGLESRININIKDGKLKLEEFNEVITEKSDSLKEYSAQEIESAKDESVVLSLEMDLQGLSNEEVLTQIKTYKDLFIRSNPDKEIDGVQVNVKSGDTEYKYNSKYENILSTSEKINL